MKFEYWRYYRHEFQSYRDYLIKRFNLREEEVEQFNLYRAFYKEMTFEEDEQIPQLMEDDNMELTLKEFSGGVCV